MFYAIQIRKSLKKNVCFFYHLELLHTYDLFSQFQFGRRQRGISSTDIGISYYYFIDWSQLWVSGSDSKQLIKHSRVDLPERVVMLAD